MNNDLTYRKDFRLLELGASQNAPMPDGDLEDQMCFLALRSLYTDLRAGNVLRDRASKERKMLQNSYRLARCRHMQQIASYKQYQFNILAAGDDLSKILKGVRCGVSYKELFTTATHSLGKLLGEDVTYQAVLAEIRGREANEET
ncbi:hypothetical protein [Neobittarella massiliensis]|uniref:hypothetical protein n=1 Tax=Neobittarella massiliensis (ex Bilen et al. 2018) TaxID=2041842 RepID=UPI000CF6C438|nr:hypothetical protein [Neobittarella massiliensis]